MARGKRARRSPTPSSSSYVPSSESEEASQAKDSPVAAPRSDNGSGFEETSSTSTPTPTPPPVAPAPPPPPPPTTRVPSTSTGYRTKMIHDPLMEAIRNDSCTNECFERYTQICGWKVLQNRFVDIDSIDASFPAANLDAIMATQGLTTFMKIKFPCYPDMVRRFYANLLVDNKEGTEASVRMKGIRININKANLCSWFNFKPNGRSTINRTYKGAHTTKDAVWTQLAGGRDEYHAGQHRIKDSLNYYLPTQQCTREFRILLLIMARTIIPKTGHFDEIREDTGLAVVDMASDVALDWADFIFHHLKHPPPKQLWFGNMISKILELHNVPLQGEAKEKQSILNHTTLIKMGIIRSYMTVDVPPAPAGQGEEEQAGEPEAEEEEEEEGDFDFTIPPEDTL